MFAFLPRIHTLSISLNISQNLVEKIEENNLCELQEQYLLFVGNRTRGLFKGL